MPILFGGEVIGISKGQMDMAIFSSIEKILVGIIIYIYYGFYAS